MIPTSLNVAVESLWAGNSPVYAATTLLISVALWVRCPDARGILRNSWYLIAAGLVGLLAAEYFHTVNPDGSASLYHSALVLVVGAAVIRLFGLFVFRVVLNSLKVYPPSILEEILVVVAYFVWAMLRLHSSGVPLGEIVTTSAIVTAVLAFAMQDTLGNILGGLALQWDHSLKVGDWVRVGDVEGKIVDIKWRAIFLETRNWETVVIPNGSMMKNQFKVLGERMGEAPRWRRWVWFNIDYSIAPDRVISLAESAVMQAEIPCVASDPIPSCLLMDIDDSTARYALRYWLTDFAKDDPTDSQVRQHIYAALNRQGIRLAMPRQHLYLTNRDDSYLEGKQQAQLLHRMDAIRGIDLFQSLSQPELEQLAACLDYRPYAAGDIIFRQGDEDYYLYVIVAGRADFSVTAEGGRETHALELGPGDYFGEIGLMTGEPRGATGRAASALECYVLGKQNFTDFLMTRDAVIEEISRIAASRESALQRARASVVEPGQSPPPAHSVQELVGRVRQFIGITDKH